MYQTRFCRPRRVDLDANADLRSTIRRIEFLSGAYMFQALTY